MPVPSLALVRVPVAPLHAEARVSSAQTSQSTFGHVVTLVEPSDAWCRVRTLPDGYEGWMHAGYLTPIVDPELDALVRSVADLRDAVPPETVSLDARPRLARISLGCTILAGARTLRLPLGAWIGADVPLLEGTAVAFDALAAEFPSEGEAIVRTAVRYFGSTSYQWGGVTPWGADCSGYVQTVFALHGIDLPRDASQQIAVGEDAGTDLAAHTAGDLLFFSEREDRRITHVGLAAGGGRMLHVALGRGGFADHDLAAEDDPYVVQLRARLVAARTGLV